MIKYIYKISNDINQKSYIGQTFDVKKRFWKHQSIARTCNYNEGPMYDDMNLYGIEHFNIEILEECDELLADEKERFWIKKLNTLVPNGYNILVGGKQLFGTENVFYGKHHSDETKKLISSKNKGRIQSEEEIEKRKIINSKENNPFFGKRHSDETKAKIKKTCEENGVYEQISKRMKENNPNKDGKFAKKRKCKMIDKNTNETIKIFDSLTEAGQYCKDLGLTKAIQPSNQIFSVCKGIDKSAFGYFWSYVNEDVSTNENNL